MSSYIVRVGETITDVVMDATGSLINWDAVLTANGFTEWVPDIMAWLSVVIPDDMVVLDQNTKRQLERYPACNASINDVYDKIAAVFNQIFDNWILETGLWNDNALWIDSKTWID